MPDSVASRLNMPSSAMGDMLRALAGQWRNLLLCACAGLTLTILALHLVTPRYTASLIVGPTGRSGPAAMGPRAPALSPAAGRGIAEQGSAEELVSDFSRYLALLTSVPVAERLVRDQELMHRLFEDAWDAEAGRWRPPTGPGSMLVRGLRWLAGHAVWSPPDAVDLSRHLKKYLAIESVSGGPLRRLVYRHEERDFALLLLTRLHAATEAHLRAEAERRLRAEMTHVNGRLSGIANLDRSRLLSGMVTEQEEMLMMLDVGLPYAADLLEPPAAAALADWPNPVPLIPAGALAGLGLGLFAVAARHGYRRGL
ncbi:hypothetical protein IP70_06595 [alpha proteobacterium AAP38]|uniref:hypothetical protein n=1 Tax=Niveispirillum sp. TaxID=1917217 RepID=UPI0006B90E6E|nr:hypothetical protein IP70_06595 [alpha proteobacterium AAP38]